MSLGGDATSLTITPASSPHLTSQPDKLDPVQIVSWFVRRWSVEVTFQETRAHLGVETQRQWSDRAIARTTPCLLALFSIVTLLATRLSARERRRTATTAWYAKHDQPSPTPLQRYAAHCGASRLW